MRLLRYQICSHIDLEHWDILCMMVTTLDLMGPNEQTFWYKTYKASEDTRELCRAVSRQEIVLGFEFTSKNWEHDGETITRVCLKRELANFITILRRTVIMNHGMECDGIIFGL